MKHLFSNVLLISALWTNSLLPAYSLPWKVYPDSQQDSLPTPNGAFELRGIGLAQDDNFLYVSVFASPKLLSGVQYKDVTIHVGDLFFNYPDGRKQAVRLATQNRSEIPYGRITSNIEPFSVSELVYGQSSMERYETKVKALGIIPYNTYSSNSLLSEQINPLARITQDSTFSDIQFVPYDGGDNGLGNSLVTVKVPKAALLSTDGTISLSLECGNDFLEVDIPELSEVTRIAPINYTEGGQVDIIDSIAVSADSATLEYVVGGVAVATILYLLLSGEDAVTAGLPTQPTQPKPPIVPIPQPPVTRDIPENSSIFSLLFVLFLFKRVILK